MQHRIKAKRGATIGIIAWGISIITMPHATDALDPGFIPGQRLNGCLDRPTVATALSAEKARAVMKATI